MNNKEKGILEDKRTDSNGPEVTGIGDLNSQEALDVTNRLVKEFIDTKQRMLTDDRKLNAIGKALINQKQMLDDILDAQDDRGNELTNSLNDISDRQDNLAKGVFNIISTMKGIEEAQDEQDKLVQNLNHFQERHDELVNKTTEQSNQSIERLENISEQVSNLFTQVEEVDIENRVVDIADRTAEINELMKTHAQKQEDAREEASNKMLDLLAEVTSFRQELSDEGLIGKLETIQNVSDENNKMIDGLNEKFDMFVEIYEISKVESIEGLEDIFADSNDLITDEYIDDIEEITFESEDMEIDTVEEEELLEDILDDYDEETIDDILDDYDDKNYCNEENKCEEVIDPDPEYSVYTDDESDDQDEEEQYEEEQYEEEQYEEEQYEEEQYEEEQDEEQDEEEQDEEEQDESNDDVTEFGNDMDIVEFKRVEKEKDSMDTTKNEEKKGFFSKLFGGR